MSQYKLFFHWHLFFYFISNNNCRLIWDGHNLFKDEAYLMIMTKGEYLLRQSELLPSLGVRRPSSIVRRPLTFRILIFSSETSQLNYLKPLVGTIYGRSSLKIAHFVPIYKQTWPPQAILVSDWPIFKNLLLWNRLAKWTETW